MKAKPFAGTVVIFKQPEDIRTMAATAQLLHRVQKTGVGNNFAQRAEHVRDVIASAKIEGLEITAHTKSLFDKYAEGKIEIDEVLDGISNTYGPRA